MPKKDRTPPVWSVPHPLNPFFTGRAKVLNDLRNALADLRAVNLVEAKETDGLGGAGKTETAAAYAYRSRATYRAVIWLRGDSEWTLTADLLATASLLGLGPNPRQPWDQTVQRVFRWLEQHQGWLVVLDNLDDPGLLTDWPPSRTKGHVLVISRKPVTGVPGLKRTIELSPLIEEEAVRFLFKRTGRLDNSTAERKAAAGLAGALGHYPLALEQAGAYLTAKGLSFREYLTELKLLNDPHADHHSPQDACRDAATSTWALAYREIRRDSPASAELLRASAFLAIDHIPYDLIAKAGRELGPSLASVLNETTDNPQVVTDLLEPLRRYALARPDPEGRYYVVHPVLQELIKQHLDVVEQGHWADRIIRLLKNAVPLRYDEGGQSPRELLAQAQVLVSLVKEGLITNLDTGHLLKHLADSVRIQGGFAKAEPLYRYALTISETALGAKHRQVAQILHQLAGGYAEVSNYSQARKHYKRSLALLEEVYGAQHPQVAACLHGLACVYTDLGRPEKAEALFKRTLAVAVEVLPPGDPSLRSYLTSLARFYHAQNRFEEAETFYRQALSSGDTQDHPDFAAIMNNLAGLYHQQRKYDLAEPLLRRSLALAKRSRVPEHPDLAVCLNNLAALYFARQKYAEAEPLYEQALAIREQHLPPHHPDLLTTLDNYSLLLRKLKRAREAVALEERAKEIRG